MKNNANKSPISCCVPLAGEKCYNNSSRMPPGSMCGILCVASVSPDSCRLFDSMIVPKLLTGGKLKGKSTSLFLFEAKFPIKNSHVQSVREGRNSISHVPHQWTRLALGKSDYRCHPLSLFLLLLHLFPHSLLHSFCLRSASAPTLSFMLSRKSSF